MTLSAKLGVLFRRDASLRSVQRVRELDRQRIERLGLSAAELNERFARQVTRIEKRVAALEAEVLGTERVG